MPKVTWIKPKVNELAALFSTYRKARGMTSAQIAEEIGCTAQNVRVQMNKPGSDWNIGQLLPHEFRIIDMGGYYYIFRRHYSTVTVICLLQERSSAAQQIQELFGTGFAAHWPQTGTLPAGHYNAITVNVHIFLFEIFHICL